MSIVSYNVDIELDMQDLRFRNRDEAESYIDSLTKEIDRLLADLDLAGFPVAGVEVNFRG